MHSCIFCQIAATSAPAKIVYEDDDVIAFHDVRPVAPVHLLICPKKHIPTLNDLTVADHPLLGKIFETATKLAVQFGIHNRGYRTVFNCNGDAGQTVYHIHLHLIGGRSLSWPPG